MKPVLPRPARPDPGALEYVPCDLCGAIDPHPLLTIADQPLVECGYCGLIYVSPRRRNIVPRTLDFQIHILSESHARRIKAKFTAAPKVLEIGKGSDKNWLRLGLSADQVERTTLDMLDTNQGKLGDLSPDTFDLILVHSLEHTTSPLALAVAVRKLLKPGSGQAIFWVHNAQSWDARLFRTNWAGWDSWNQNQLYTFTPVTIRRLLESAKLRPETIYYTDSVNIWAGSIISILVRFNIRPEPPPNEFTTGIPIKDRILFPLAGLIIGVIPAIVAAAFHRSGAMYILASKESPLVF